VNFWPDVTLDEYIDLKSKVETRMKIVDMTATGDDDIISEEEQTDLEYRKSQLQRLKEEVVDIEDMSTGISIMDLGLNEFRLDLLEYIKHNPDIDKTPFGLHSVAKANDDTPAGVIYVLKNRAGGVNIDNQNRLHPFYMVYISNEGEVICNHLSPKKMLDKMRYLCKGKTEPIAELYKEFNKETYDGKNMDKYSRLLGDAISSIISVKEESDIDSLFTAGGTSALMSQVSGLDDFELICFLVIK
ncbi:MAG: ATP-dependent helicase, partial [Clostridiales bacterium]|nr:ATP-dependent helicase [Candidatus Coliplasma equi]